MLHHYTSIESFMGMSEYAPKVNSNSHLLFWASSVYVMNDSSEFEYGIEALNKTIKEYEEKTNVDKEYRMSSAFEEYIAIDPFFKSAEELRKKYFTNNPKTPFIISFSKKEDDLSMWSMYGNGGHGLCLVFSEDIPHFSLNDNITSHDPTPVHYGKDIEQHVTLYERFRENYIKSLNIIMQASKKERPTIKMYEKSRLYAFIAPFVKDPAFSEEEEVRIATFLNSLDSVKFRCRNNRVIPYVEAPISFEYLKKIIIGPCCDELSTRRAISFILEKHGINRDTIINNDVIIEKSHIPYII
ncbi:MAG: DUF2971 domain-containing protein [Prevotella sp.]|nr:DUF2971 domain-containing protein [Prevotella sp.]